MLRRNIVVGLVTSLTWGSAAFAQDKPAAPPAAPAQAEAKPDAPAKPPAGPEAELRATLKTLAKSLQDGDRAGILAVLYAADDTQRKMIDAMAGMAVEIASLYKASAKAFGEEQAKTLTGDLGAEMARIDGAEVKIDGDTATVRYAAAATTKPVPPAGSTPSTGDAANPPDEEAAPSAPLVLKRIEGRWRVPVAELSKDTTPEEIEQRLGDLATQTKVIVELSGEVAKGKYKSAEKAAEAWQAKMMQALTPPRKPEKSAGKDAAGAEKSK